MANTSVGQISFEKFNFIDTPKILNHDNTVDIYFFVNGDLHWLILMPDVNNYSIQRFRCEDDNPFYMYQIISQKPEQNAESMYRRLRFRRKYTMEITRDHSCIYFKRINALTSLFHMLDICIDETEYNDFIIETLPKMLLKSTENDSNIEIEGRDELQYELIERCGKTKAIYYSEKMRRVDETRIYNKTMKKIIEYYNKTEDAEWRDAVFHVVGVSSLYGENEFEEPCIPAGEKLTWETYKTYCMI
jgi:hypothetical protein